LIQKPFLKDFYILIIDIMELKISIHLGDSIENDKEVVERLVETNLNTKINSYLKKYDDKQSATWSINLKLTKNKKDLFDGKMIVNLDKDEFVFERDDYENLDDLVNNFFKHLKESLSDK